jgi:hypothetical protein
MAGQAVWAVLRSLIAVRTPEAVHGRAFAASAAGLTLLRRRVRPRKDAAGRVLVPAGS